MPWWLARTRHHRLAYAAWLAVCLIWGTTYLAIRIALETIPPTLVGGIRFVVAGATLSLLVRIQGGRLPPLREWPRQALLGTLLLALGNGCVVWSERWIPSGIAAVGVAALPFWDGGERRHPSVASASASRVHIPSGPATGFGGILVLIRPACSRPMSMARGSVSGFSWFRSRASGGRGVLPCRNANAESRRVSLPRRRYSSCLREQSW